MVTGCGNVTVLPAVCGGVIDFNSLEDIALILTDTLI